MARRHQGLVGAVVAVISPRDTLHTTTQMLNALVGCMLAKGRVLVGVAAYDLLNRGSNFTTTTYADYEMQRWQPSFGRYFTFNVGIRLNKASQREFGAGSGRRR